MKLSLTWPPVFLLIFSFSLSTAQIITTDPALPTPGRSVIVYYDATYGTAGLKDFTGDVYAYTGVLTDQSTGSGDWKYVKADWKVNTPETKMTRESANLYSLEIGPSIRAYYGVPAGETITHLAFVFRSADSSKEGKDDGGADIFAEVFNDAFSVHILQPDQNLVVDPGEIVSMEAASNYEAELSLYLDNVLVKTVTGTGIMHSFDMGSGGDFWIRVEAASGGVTVADSVFVHVLETRPEVSMPDTLADGINYADPHTVQLVLFAPGKEHVFVIGDFNAWVPASEYRMNKDGDRFWITLNNLEPGTEYAYQYLVDASLTIADPYSEKVLDPWNDKWIPELTYPGLKAYPEDFATGIAGVLRTDNPEYDWEDSAYEPPEKENLVIYELLMRDFLEAHDWKTLTDTLDYFSRLGVNAIELMPVNEFEGNESWGYNPSFYFAPDKYYGPARDLKVLIDSCHRRGIAVILDMVLNHSYGQSPMVRLYFDSSTGKVTADNPWYNVESPNPAFSWGYDFNHESPATQYFVDRVNRYWLEEFHVDGFRFDFTKGFTNTPGEGDGYDESRINILKRMAGQIWLIRPDAYVILEHFTANAEEFVLSKEGMMLWGNLNSAYNEATMGYMTDSDFSGISYLERFWTSPALVGYMESHDEQRLMYKNLEYGNSSGDYNIQDLSTALGRMELAGLFFFPVPGPKMLWQFGELGYDYSIDYGCRTCNKPIRWDYYSVGLRRRVYQVWSALIDLKLNEPAFGSGDFTLNVSDAAKRVEINHTDMDVRIVGNFGVEPLSVNPNFSKSGMWYSYFDGDSLQITDLQTPVSLDPGQYRLFTSKRLLKPEITAGLAGKSRTEKILRVYPNPLHGILHLEPLPVPSRLTLYDNSGKVMLQVKLHVNQEQVNLPSLAPGIYILSRRYGNGPAQHVKVMVQ